MKPNDNKALFLILLLLLLGIFLIIRKQGVKDQASVLPNSQPAKGETAIVQEINRDLKDASLKSEMRVQEIENGNSQMPSVDPTLPMTTDLPQGQSESDVIPLEFEQENSGEQVMKDTELGRKKARRPMTPEQRISAKLDRDAWVRDQQKREQDTVVRQFLENARAGGVNVRLNENLDVTGVAPMEQPKPIRVPKSFSNGAK